MSPHQGRTSLPVLSSLLPITIEDGSYTRESFCCPALLHRELKSHRGARTLHHFCISVNPLAESSPTLLSGVCASSQGSSWTGADVDVSDVPGSHRFWRYLLGLPGHTWLGSGSTLRRRWESGLHSQGELSLSCVRLVGCGVRDCRSIMESCLKFLPQLGQQMSLGHLDMLCCFHH